MRGRRRHVSGPSLARLPAALLLVLLLGAPWLAAAQDASAPVEVYRSSEFGYLFWWDTSVWSIDDHEKQAGYDLLRLVSDTAATAIWGYAEPGATAEGCLNETLDAIAADPDLIRYEGLQPPGSPPNPVVSENGLYAWAGLVLAFDLPNGRFTLADMETCLAVGPGQIVSTSVWTPAEVYNAQYSRFGETPASLLTLPRSAWTFVPGQPVHLRRSLARRR
jgi:hypothetical protein